MSEDGSGPGGETVWRRSGSTAYVGSDDHVVVLDLDHLDRQPYVFDGSAAQVWLCLDGDRSESEIVADLAEAYGVPPEVVLDDVRAFIDELRDLRLVIGGTDA